MLTNFFLLACMSAIEFYCIFFKDCMHHVELTSMVLGSFWNFKQ